MLHPVRRAAQASAAGRRLFFSLLASRVTAEHATHASLQDQHTHPPRTLSQTFNSFLQTSHLVKIGKIADIHSDLEDSLLLWVSLIRMASFIVVLLYVVDRSLRTRQTTANGIDIRCTKDTTEGVYASGLCAAR